ncbi:MAG: isocitrate lyase/phosphoenolpyruvate mutase family protein [bacterium]|nr:isocitrate lyase/phosphoenolpyruvate mutase family protein [bacterium]
MKQARDLETLRAKAQSFLALHTGSEPLILCNVWDAGSARVVEAAGFPALATTSSGVANALGYPDGEAISREEMADAVARIVAHVAVPVSADMEAGYGARPEDAAESARAALAAGAVGINLEDAAPARDAGLFPIDAATERIRAARAAADTAGVHLVINARTDVYLRGGKGEAAFEEAVRRANAYRAAGADSLFVPGVAEAALIGRLAKAVQGPLNVLAGSATPPVSELKRLGVARISVGGAAARAALTAVRRAAEELRSSGTFGFANGIISHGEMNDLLVLTGKTSAR